MPNIMNICEVLLIPLCHDFVPGDYLTNLLAIALLFLLDIKSVGIGIIHLSLPFLCTLCVLCGLIIPIQPELI